MGGAGHRACGFPDACGPWCYGRRAVRPREFRVSRSRRASCNEVPQVEQKGAAWRTQPGRERRCSNAGAHLGRDTPRGQPWSLPPNAR